MYSLLSIVASVAELVGLYFLFRKMGMQGWECLIPFYSEYKLFEKAWSKKSAQVYLGMCAAICIIALFFGVVMLIPLQSAGVLIFFLFLLYVWLVVMLALDITCLIKLARSLGQSGIFAVGLVLFTPIFYCIAAFDKDIEYIGPEGIVEDEEKTVLFTEEPVNMPEVPKTEEAKPAEEKTVLLTEEPVNMPEVPKTEEAKPAEEVKTAEVEEVEAVKEAEVQPAEELPEVPAVVEVEVKEDVVEDTEDKAEDKAEAKLEPEKVEEAEDVDPVKEAEEPEEVIIESEEKGV